MEQLAFIYKDSLFSVAVLAFIIGGVILLDYCRSTLAHRRNLKILNALSLSYTQVELAFEVQQLLQKEQENPLEVLGFKTWMFLAKHYATYGSSEQAIKIYLVLLPKYQNERIVILENLAKAYIDMGYVQKARDILVEVLRIDPRNTHALQAMVQVYETMCDPQTALEILECLDALGESRLLDDYYYLQMQVLMEQDLGLEDKSMAILELGRQQSKLYKLALKHLKTYHKTLFFEEIAHLKETVPFIDLLWDIDYLEIKPYLQDLHPHLLEVFVAKGYIQGKCHTLELEVFKTFQKQYALSLNFSYKCTACKSLSPFESYRCLVCAKIGPKEVILSLDKHPSDYSKNSNLN
ncbi:tetratricopeptide repeat protein [Helicobacter suis]|uniref:TPR_REGION domain-containing protein n=1 Tax=Helicobacter suis TaxID=104628 RepID=A0A6J4CZS2_9HELI|nr:hypothetical protein [Helicobacter suis]BCD46548.1 TPR_REGION domain-containing protein [Helicobacter suis]BCD49297.1 TPR_REGION domain-containing protein [Helicobacter suis]BCD51332.1 TPR_REGION domain-containing protein [Helicobacter suis]BCD70881.1 TPR_REGION domain-containing protein [Helicobacter suis]GFK17046.1 TPR_REGION domain-containing protein [Helicobacter suis]